MMRKRAWMLLVMGIGLAACGHGEAGAPEARTAARGQQDRKEAAPDLCQVVLDRCRSLDPANAICKELHTWCRELVAQASRPVDQKKLCDDLYYRCRARDPQTVLCYRIGGTCAKHVARYPVAVRADGPIVARSVSDPPPPRREIPAEVKEMLQQASSAYVAGNHPEAIEIAKKVLARIPDQEFAAHILAASSCYLHRREDALRMMPLLPPSRHILLIKVCERNGIKIEP